jgi:hypothetical protein
MTLIPLGTRFEGIPVSTRIDLRSEQINESLTVYTMDDIIYTSGQYSSSIASNGFRLIGPINSNIILPDNSILEYTGPLVMGLGYSITVPLGTTLTII